MIECESNERDPGQILAQAVEALNLPHGTTFEREAVSQESEAGIAYRFQQQLDGVPVHGARAIVVVRGDRARLELDGLSRLRPEKHDPKIRISRQEARARARSALPPASTTSGAASVERVYAPRGLRLRLAYRVDVQARPRPLAEPRGVKYAPRDWRLLVDAVTGEVFDFYDRVRCAAITGRGNVYHPNPVATRSDTTLRYPNPKAHCPPPRTSTAELNKELIPVSLHLERTTPTQRLTGEHIEILDPAPQATGGDFGKIMSDDPDLGAVMIYHHVDEVCRYLEKQCGFRFEPATKLTARHLDNTRPNSWYSPEQNCMYFDHQDPCRPPKSQDAHVILHEFGHAILTHQLGKPEGVSARDAYEEGFSDFFSLVYFAAQNPKGSKNHIFESWAMADVGGARDLSAERPLYPEYLDLSTPHDRGRIWAGALWDAYQRMIAYGTDPGAARDRLLRLLLVAHAQMVSFLFSSAADTLIRVQRDLFGDATLEEHLRAAFARKRIPVSV